MTTQTTENVQRLWFGYEYRCGGYQVKRYFSEQDIREAEESPFVVTVVTPFAAANREDALKIVKECCYVPD